MNRNYDDMRIEMKIGLLLLAAFGIFNVVINAHEVLCSFTFSLAIVFLVVGGIREESYKKLKEWKKLIFKR